MEPTVRPNDFRIGRKMIQNYNPNNTTWEEQQPEESRTRPESGQTERSAEHRNDVKSRALPTHGLTVHFRPTSIGGSEHSRIDGDGTNATAGRALRCACRRGNNPRSQQGAETFHVWFGAILTAGERAQMRRVTGGRNWFRSEVWPMEGKYM